jgi:hypothetical protein
MEWQPMHVDTGAAATLAGAPAFLSCAAAANDIVAAVASSRIRESFIRMIRLGG